MYSILKQVKQPTEAVKQTATAVLIEKCVIDIRKTDGFGVDRWCTDHTDNTVLPYSIKQKCFLRRSCFFLFLRNLFHESSNQFYNVH